MDHPTAGSTQMFRRDLDDAGFQQVLENPRAHTGQVSSSLVYHAHQCLHAMPPS